MKMDFTQQVKLATHFTLVMEQYEGLADKDILVLKYSQPWLLMNLPKSVTNNNYTIKLLKQKSDKNNAFESAKYQSGASEHIYL